MSDRARYLSEIILRYVLRVMARFAAESSHGPANQRQKLKCSRLHSDRLIFAWLNHTSKL